MLAGTDSGAEPGRSDGGNRRWPWLPPLVLVILGIGTVVAFGYSQRLKREPLIIDRVEYRAAGVRPSGPRPTVFSPNGDCIRDRILISFRTTRSDRADVEIISREGRVVKRLVRNRFFKRYREHRLAWGGHREDGSLAATGPYWVRVKMHAEGRVLYLPGRIRLHRFRPTESACPVSEQLEVEP